MSEIFDNAVTNYFKTIRDEQARLEENKKQLEEERLAQIEKNRQWYIAHKDLPPEMTDEEKENTIRLINGGFKVGETRDYGNLTMRLEQIDLVKFDLVFTVIDVGQYWHYNNGDTLTWQLIHCWDGDELIFEEKQSRNMELKGCCAQRLLYVTDYGEDDGGIIVNAEMDT